MLNKKFAIVLSGGGAKGAYHVGVLKALDELGIEIQALAGASIGALNGAIVATASNQSEAIRNIESIWHELANTSPISLNGKSLKYPAYLAMLGAFGLTSPVLATLTRQLGALSVVANHAWMPQVVKNLSGYLGITSFFDSKNQGLLCDSTLKGLIDKYLGKEGVKNHLPFYVSVYPTQSTVVDFMKIIGASLGVGDTQDSHFYHVQKMSLDDQRKVLLASAALPLLYTSQEINGQLYTDGGQGGWRSIQGNTPATPLIKAGYKNIIVTHLNDGSVWDRSQYPDANIIEIRPKSRSISRAGAVKDVLGFDNEKIPSWISQGYEDTMQCVAPILKLDKTFTGMHEAEVGLQSSLAQSNQQKMLDALKNLDF